MGSVVSGLFGGGGGDIPMPTDYLKSGQNGGLSMAAKTSKQLGSYYNTALPSTMETMAKYGPQFMQQGFRFGQQGLTGLMGLQQQAGAGAAQQMADLRAQELGAMTGQTGLFRGLAEALSPEQASAVQRAQAEADRAYAASQGITPQERRGYEQQAREAFQASGRLGGNAGIVAEAMGREDVLAAKRAEAAQAGQRAFGLAGQFYTNRGLSMLGATPASYGAGSSLAAAGLGLGESMTPQLDYNLGLNLARERAGALDARNMAQYEADQKARASKLGAITSLVGLAAMPFTGGLSAGLGLTGLAGGAAGATGMSGLGLSAGMGLSNLFGGIPKATPV